MSLYRIKPLEWFPSGQSSHEDYRVFKEKGKFKACYGEWDAEYEVYTYRELGVFDEMKTAQSCCEAHRRKLLEAELELIHDRKELPETKTTRMFVKKFVEKYQQPTTELPTEPGYYWWRNPTYPTWLVVLVSRAHIFFGGKHFNREEWGEAYEPGQWLRIPEPEA